MQQRPRRWPGFDKRVETKLRLDVYIRPWPPGWSFLRRIYTSRGSERVNPLWFHRSILIDSNLGALQPYFLVVMVTAVLVPGSGCWAGSQRFAITRFQLRSRRQRGLEVYLSIWENSALLGKLGSLSVTWRTKNWDAVQEATHCAVLALGHGTHSSWWLLFATILLANFSVCHERLDLFFVISETITFRQGN